MNKVGEYNGWPTYVVPYGEPVPVVEDNVLYLAHTSYGYDMYINGELVGWCDAKYRVQEFQEPQRRVTTPSCAVEVLETPPAPVAQKKEEDADFWSKVAAKVQDVLDSIKI